jgi:hypothetical protein
MTKDTEINMTQKLINELNNLRQAGDNLAKYNLIMMGFID